MMKNGHGKKEEHSIHQYEKVELSTGEVDYHYYQCSICHQISYPPAELQKLWELSERGRFMFVQDWILALLNAQPAPMVGITNINKQVFLVLNKFAPEHGIPTEDPGFRAYRFGPYSERMEDIVLGLEDAGVIRTEGRRGGTDERFMLTEEGKEPASRSFAKLSKEQQEELREARQRWDELGSEGLMTFINEHCPDVVEGSVVLEKALERRRVGMVGSKGRE
jgi:hypothetical protein